MSEEARQFAARWGIPFAVAVLAILARAVMNAQRDWLSVARTVLVGLLVGAVVNLYLADTTWLSDGQRGAVVGVAVVVAEDVVAALIRLVRKLRENPLGILNWVLTSFTKLPPVPTRNDENGKQS